MTQVHVFGDTGGHGKQLFASLERIGVDLKLGIIPENTVIVHLGDLIHRGPLSDAIVSTVDTLMERNPGQWLQILGNHESQHLEAGMDFWRCSCSRSTAWTIERWYEEETARIAWGFEGVLPQHWTLGNRPLNQEGIVSSFLATHGGLTYPTWRQIGSPESAERAAELLQLNRHWYMDSVGQAMGFERAGRVGPIWARAAGETHRYWDLAHVYEDVSMPFGQLIGHSAPYSFERKLWYANTPEIFKKNAKIIPAERRTMSFVAESMIACMDPDYGVNLNPATDPLQPYLSFEIEAK